MRTRTRIRTALRGISGAVAVMFWLALAVPGLLMDRASIVPGRAQEVRR